MTGATQARDAADPKETYPLNLYVYGKLVQGQSPSGPIRQGADYRNTGLSAGFPQGLQVLCAPERFVRYWQGAITVDARVLAGGAMLYRPVYVNGRHYGLFARIQQRSEAGAGRSDRNYAHCAVLAIADKWEPDLIPNVAALLFEENGDCLGLPNFEGQKDRMALNPPPLSRNALRSAPATAEGGPHPMVSLAVDLARRLKEAGLSVTGRWLPFAFGVRAGITPPVGKFHALHTDKSGQALDLWFEKPSFDDKRPPFLDANALSNGEIDAGRFPERAYHGAQQLTWRTDNLWPDQQLSQPAAAAAAKARLGDFLEETTGSTVFAFEQDDVAGRKIDNLDRELLKQIGNAERNKSYTEKPEKPVSASAMSRPAASSLPLTSPSPRIEKTESYIEWFSNVYPKHKYYMSSVDFRFIRAARDYLTGKLDILSEPYFTRYDECKSDIFLFAAIQAVTRIVMRVAAERDPAEILDYIDTDLYSMPEFPVLKVPASGLGSPISHLNYELIRATRFDNPTHAKSTEIYNWFSINALEKQGTGRGEYRAEDLDEAVSRFTKAHARLRDPNFDYLMQDPVWGGAWQAMRFQAGRFTRLPANWVSAAAFTIPDPNPPART